jgi:drug/metabolite transporter (DMT)-like permease
MGVMIARRSPLPPTPLLTGALAALAAALCWTLSSALWRRLPTSLTAAQLNLLKNLLALVLLAPALALLPWHAGSAPLLPLAASGIVGIALGDSLYFAALRRLGTRRCLTLDAGGPAVTAVAGLVWLAEWPSPRQWLGVALISLAVLLVARQQPQGDGRTGAMETGDRRLGLLLALGALVCGSGGALLARAALRAGELLPLQSAALRLAAAALVLMPLLQGLPRHPPRPRPAQRRWPLWLAATLLGTAVGIVLQQTALQLLPGALAVALLATAPVMALPLARLEGDPPGVMGAVAALLTVAGVSCVVA